MSRTPSHSRRGFTLVELLVASAIMITLVLIVAKVAVDTLTAYDRVVADLATQSEARAVLDNMERDINTAVIRPDGRCWMEIIAPGATGDTSGITKLPQIPSDLQPVVMFFAAPTDRPRWSITAGVRTAISGETSAVCYRLGRRSPFDLPGQTILQVYCFQRTVIDAQNTFNEAIPLLTVPTGALNAVTTGTPFNYWNASRTYVSAYGSNTSGALIGAAVVAPDTNGGWTMDEQNFCAQNTVALSLTLWCASSQTTTEENTARAITRLVKLPPSALRPLMCWPAGAGGDSTQRGALNSAGSGIRSCYAGIMPNTATTLSTTGATDFFGYRARVYSDRIQIDANANPLPYTLRQVEASVTVLSPAGARELRALQARPGLTPDGIRYNENTAASEFRRIVSIHGRPYSRRMILLGNGN